MIPATTSVLWFLRQNRRKLNSVNSGLRDNLGREGGISRSASRTESPRVLERTQISVTYRIGLMTI